MTGVGVEGGQSCQRKGEGLGKWIVSLSQAEVCVSIERERERGGESMSSVLEALSVKHCEQRRARERTHTHTHTHTHTRRHTFTLLPLVHTLVHTCLHVCAEAEQCLV